MSENYEKEHRTRPVMSKYEVTKIISARVQQLSEGAPSTLSSDHEAHSKGLMNVAVAELEERTLPMMITRELPDGSKELWKLDQLRLPKTFMRHVRSIQIM